jgi:hypothetical protein
MIPIAIFAFLIGAVLSWAFRVWILIPITLLAIIALMIFQLLLGTNFLTALESCLLLGLAPQLGYAFGLMARNGLVMLRPPRRARAVISGNRHSIKGAQEAN